MRASPRKQPPPARSQRRAKPFLIAIVGGSGAGKTWLAARLTASFGRRAAQISLDDFYRDRSHLPASRRALLNFDHPRAIDWPALEKVLRRFASGRAAKLPCYDFRTHCRSKKTRILRAREILVVDGLWLLRRPSLRKLFDFSIFIECPARARLQRRIARDAISRGRSRQDVLRQFQQTVEPMHALYVASQARHADLVLCKNTTQSEAASLAARVLAMLA